ncbi:lactate racemase domain-containing protein [uncultured Gimesia sp.]|uniref:lactate racemase domain-containing protein n=1 Tax=uncultured Gimesia sp. TaxID=1678688 RepID=UPI00260959F1|nr:lactate racemase domain-containing protein [uncultured Gimesia sp.]
MNIDLPKAYRIRQNFQSSRLENIPETIQAELAKINLGKVVKAGDSVAITVGSRGIANIDLITKTTVDFLKSLDAVPFIVPAMGSHGGGTAEGQAAVIAGYGITEETMGVEIRSSMETVIVDTTSQGIPVHFDKHAFEADHVLICGRVKPHTRFVGDIESGLHKMMLIGLGKHAGAKIYHRAIEDFSFEEIIKSVAQSVLEKCSVVGGLAIVENSYDETGLIEAIPPKQFYEREKALLNIAREWLPRLPFEKIDFLIVDRIGKNISGSGMDACVIGRKFNDHAATEQDNVDVKRIMVRSLTEETHGNALGIGLAEFTNQRTIDGIDWKITRINANTGSHPTSAMVPLVYETDKEAIEAALSTIGLVEPEQSRIVQIYDTLELSEVIVSETYLNEINERDDLEIMSGPFEFPFDTQNNLTPVFEKSQH